MRTDLLRLDQRKSHLILIIISIILLIPTLFHPIFGDIAIFLEAGRAIATGKLIYVDYVDVKPPGFFYLFAVIYKIFGFNDIGVRLFSFIWQSTTIILLNIVIVKYLKDKLIAGIASLIYSISFVVLGYNGSITPESLFALLFLISFILFYDKKIINLLLMGFVIGVIIGFKYSFGVVAVSFVLRLIINKEQNAWKSSCLIIIGSIVGFGTTLLPLLSGEVFEGFMNVNRFLGFYSSIPELNTDFLKHMLTSTSMLFTYNYSMSFFVFFIIGVFFVFQQKKYSDNEFLNIVMILSFLLFISIIIERKLSVLHYPRLILPLSLLSAIGLVETFRNIKFKNYNLLNKGLLVSLILLLFVFSPFIRYSKEMLIMYSFLNDKHKYNSYYENASDNILLRQTYLDVSDYIKSKAKPHDFVKTISIGGNIINYFLKDYPSSALPQSCFYYGIFKIDDWRKMHSQELMKSNWVIVQDNDNHPYLNGHNLSSSESLRADTTNYQYIQENFRIDTTITPFIIYKRK